MSKHALLIGINVFQDSALGGLKAPAKDVRALSEILLDIERADFDSVITSLDDDLETIRSKLSDLLENRRPRDTVLIYYSGHGICSASGHLFLATGRTDAKRPRPHSLAASEVRDIIRESRATQVIVILDCCHSGAFAEGVKGPATPVTAQTFSTDDGPEGEYILMSCNALQFSYDGIDSSLSRFTSWLIDGLRGKAAPTSPIISLDDLYTYVSDCAKAAGSTMRPQRLVKRNSGIIEIARNPTAGELSAELSEKLQDVNWKTRLSAVEMLKELSCQDQLRPAIRNAVVARFAVERDRDVSIALEDLLLHIRGSHKSGLKLPADTVSVVQSSMSFSPSDSPNASKIRTPAPIISAHPTSPPRHISPPDRLHKDAPAPGALQGWEAEILARAGLSGADLSKSAGATLTVRAEAFRNGELLCVVAVGLALVIFVIFAAAIAMKRDYGTTVVLGLIVGSISAMGLFKPAEVYAGSLPDEAVGKLVKHVPITRFLRKTYDMRQFRVACWILLSAAVTSLVIGGIGMSTLATTTQ